MVMTLKERISQHKLLICFISIFAVGVLVRIINFGNVPGGINQDEAFAGYEAYSLLNFGTDSWGYVNPCYFVSWGSGMNVLESYLAIPFIRIFGCNALSIRLPSLLTGIISLGVFYLFLLRISSPKTALAGLALLVVSPWHIMICRWGLESNLAPCFLLFGFFAFVKGLKDNRYFILSAVMYGLSLYAYSLTWLVVPLTLIMFGGYLVYTKTRVSVRYTVISAAVLFIFALPLLLFLLVNNDIIHEIRTDYFSVPKLVMMREAEISLRNLIQPSSYISLFKILIMQNDSLVWNSTKQFGLFYLVSIPFLISGIIISARTAFVNIRKRKFDVKTLVFLGFISSCIVCLLIKGINVNKANSLHFYSLMFITFSLSSFIKLCKNRQIVKNTLLTVYLVSFVVFSYFYFTSYSKTIAKEFRNGVEDAVHFVNDNQFNSVYVDSSISYSVILFYDKTPYNTFSKTVTYSNYPSAFLNVTGFDKFKFGINELNLKNNNAYIITNDEKQYFEEKGFKLKKFDEFYVAY